MSGVITKNTEPTPRCPRPWCRNALYFDETLRVWKCRGCDYSDRRPTF